MILVGHSLAGSTIPLVARHRPVCSPRVSLLLLVPRPGGSVTDRYTVESVYVPGFVGNTLMRDDGASYWPEPTRRSAASTTTARTRTRRGPSPGYAHSRRRHGSSPGPWTRCRTSSERRSSAVSERVIDPAWSRRMSRELLGVEPVELDGGHSPFLSRPAELASVLAQLD